MPLACDLRVTSETHVLLCLDRSRRGGRARYLIAFCRRRAFRLRRVVLREDECLRNYSAVGHDDGAVELVRLISQVFVELFPADFAGEAVAFIDIETFFDAAARGRDLG